MRHRTSTVLVLVALAAAAPAAARQGGAALDAARRAEILDSIASALNRRYVFPEVAAKMEEDMRARGAGGDYDAAVEPPAFARMLTEQLRAVSGDKHVRVEAGRRGPPGPIGRGPSGVTGIFGATERLEGDVAYIEIRTLGLPPDAVADEVREVMSEAADAAALIVDLRANGGGRPETVALVSSYLFGDEPVHLNSIYFRPADRTEHFHTDPRVPGKKLGPHKPVYVLTSARTFSGAEEFAYNLQALGRAILIGQTTGGGANPGEPVPLPYGLSIFVPTGRAINPVTGTNWEGVGVKPDVDVAADDALETAHRLAKDVRGRPTK